MNRGMRRAGPESPQSGWGESREPVDVGTVEWRWREDLKESPVSHQQKLPWAPAVKT